MRLQRGNKGDFKIDCRCIPCITGLIFLFFLSIVIVLSGVFIGNHNILSYVIAAFLFFYSVLIFSNTILEITISSNYLKLKKMFKTYLLHDIVGAKIIKIRYFRIVIVIFDLENKRSLKGLFTYFEKINLFDQIISSLENCNIRVKCKSF
jgi:hypothetical protein